MGHRHKRPRRGQESTLLLGCRNEAGLCGWRRRSVRYTFAGGPANFVSARLAGSTIKKPRLDKPKNRFDILRLRKGGRLLSIRLIKPVIPKNLDLKFFVN